MTCNKAHIKQSKCMKMTVDCAGMVKTWFLNFNNDGQWTDSSMSQSCEWFNSDKHAMPRKHEL